MRSPRRSLSRASSIGFGTLFLAVSYACSEQAVGPSAADEANPFAVSGILTSSLWRTNGSELSFAGSISAPAHVSQDKKGLHQEIGALSVSAAPTLPPLAAGQRFSASPLRAPVANKLPLAEGSQVTWRTRFKSPRINLTTRDGKHVSLQRIADPRGGGRPPVATMLYDGDRPVSMVEALYAKDGKRWKATRSRITIFGKDGQPLAVTESDFSGLQTASVAMPGTAAFLADGFRRVGGTLSQLVRTDVLYAATPYDDDGEGRCFKEAALLAAAAGAQVSADIALSLALVACAATGGVACPVVLAALITVASTAVVYLFRVVDYDNCMNAAAPITRGYDGSGGGGGGSEGDGCYDVIWEISYDGGWSWDYFNTERVCGRQYDM